MKHLRLFMGLCALMLACITAQAKKGDTFTIGDLSYTVLAAENETKMTGTVSVKKANNNISGDIVIPATVSYNGYTYSITQIPSMAFSSCNNMTSLTIGRNVSSIAGNAWFRYCTSLETLLVDAQNKTFYSQDNCVIKKSNKALVMGIKTSVIPNDVTSIENFAFLDSDIESVTIPATVTKIGNSAFSGTPLTTINIPSEVTSLGQAAFSKCEELQTVTFDEGCKLTTIGNNAFQYCPIETITLPDKVKTIGNNVFSNCFNLTEAHLGNDVETIGTNAFSSCKVLRYINIPEKAKVLNDSVNFLGAVGYRKIVRDWEDVASKLEIIEIAENNPYYKSVDGIIYNKDMTIIYKCPPRLGNIPEKFIVPEGIKWITGYCFYDCNEIKEMVVPQSTKHIGDYAFHYCTSLESISLPDYADEIGEYAFFCCTKLITLKLPAGITKVSKSLTDECDKLRVLKIPNSVTTLGRGLYQREPTTDLVIKHLTFPSWVEKVEDKSDYGGLFGNQTSFTTALLPPYEVTIPAYFKDVYSYLSCLELDKLFCMGDEIPNNLTNIGFGFLGYGDGTIYVKKSVFNDKYPDGMFKNRYTVDYKVPVSMTNASGNPIEYKTLCRDFDVDLTHTNDNLPEGVEPLRAYLVDDVDGELRYVFMNEIKYIPSRLKANVTDNEGNLYQGVDEYVGVILRGTPGYTYYYEIGEHDYTQGAGGQWLMEEAMAYSNSIDTNNMLAGDANDEFYVYKTIENEQNDEIVNYGLNSNKFKIYNKDGWLNYNKAYLQLPKDVSAAIEGNTDAEGNANLTFVFNNADGTTDKVSSVEFNRNCESDIFYNPYGQRVSKNTKGIVINNGRKIINK